MKVFYPESRPAIEAYYKRGGPKLVEMFNRHQLALLLLDEHLCKRVPAAVAAWRAFRPDAERRLGSSRAAAAEFVRLGLEQRGSEAQEHRVEH